MAGTDPMQQAVNNSLNGPTKVPGFTNTTTPKAEPKDIALDASVSVGIIHNDIKASLGENTVVNLTGGDILVLDPDAASDDQNLYNLIVEAYQKGQTLSNASGFAAGNQAAVGAAVAVNLADSEVVAEFLGKASTVFGKAFVNAETLNYDDANALALAMGADVGRYEDKGFPAKPANPGENPQQRDAGTPGEGGNSKPTTPGETNPPAGSTTTGETIANRLQKQTNNQDGQKTDAKNPVSVNALIASDAKTVPVNQTNEKAGSVTDLIGGTAGQAGKTVDGKTTPDSTTTTVGGALNGDNADPSAKQGSKITLAAAVAVNITVKSCFRTSGYGNQTSWF